MWIKGTVEAVKEWWRKETEGMGGYDLSGDMSEAPGDEFKEGHKHVSLTPELDAMKDRVKDNPIPIWMKHTGKYEVDAHNERVLRDRPVAITGTGPGKEPCGITDKHKVVMKEVFDGHHWNTVEQKESEKAKGGNWKPTNPKDLLGIRKVSLGCVSGPVLYEVALGMQEGAMKYGRHNYRSEGVAFSTYMDAAMRHMFECWEGEDIDPESGVHHISKTISTLFVLRDALLNDKCTDDRPIRPKNVSWLKDLNVKASALVDKYPQPEKPYTEKPLPEVK